MREYSFGAQIDIGSNFGPEHLSALRAIGEELTCSAGDVVYWQGDPAPCIYLLLSGQVKTVFLNSSGSECLLRIHLSHSILGLTTLATSATRDASATAMVTSRVARVPRASFLALIDEQSEFGLLIIQLLVDRMSDYHHRVGQFLTHKVNQRLAQSLLSLSRPDPHLKEDSRRQLVRLTHEELATLLNARRPTVTAILARFYADGLISKREHGIEVLDAERLGQVINDT